MSPADGSGPGLVGKPVARPNIRRLIHGKGRYTDDITVPHMLHVAFVRNPYGHARINGIDASMAETSAARSASPENPPSPLTKRFHRSPPSKEQEAATAWSP